MASNQEPLINTNPRVAFRDMSKGQKVRRGVSGCGVCLLLVFVLTWMVQGCLYALATVLSGCHPSALVDYDYVSAGGEKSNTNDEAFNVVPKIAFIVEAPHKFWGQSFSVIPTNEANHMGAPTGMWWKSWGPLFNTYVYYDIVQSQPTVYMRENLLRLGQSHRVNRCDGKGPDIWFEEGSNYFMNRIRGFFHTTQSFTYKIWMDNKVVATTEEARSGDMPSMTILNATRAKIANSALISRDFHGKYDQWIVTNTEDTVLPYYVADAATLLFGFFELNNNKADPNPPPSQLSTQASIEQPVTVATVETHV